MLISKEEGIMIVFIIFNMIPMFRFSLDELEDYYNSLGITDIIANPFYCGYHAYDLYVCHLKDADKEKEDPFLAIKKQNTFAHLYRYPPVSLILYETDNFTKQFYIPPYTTIGLNYVNGWSYDSYCSAYNPNHCSGSLALSCGKIKRLDKICLSAGKHNTVRRVYRQNLNTAHYLPYFEVYYGEKYSNVSDPQEAVTLLRKSFDLENFQTFIALDGDVYFTYEHSVYQKVNYLCIMSLDLYDIPVTVKAYRLHYNLDYVHIDYCTVCSHPGSYSEFIEKCMGPVLILNPAYDVINPIARQTPLHNRNFPINMQEDMFIYNFALATYIDEDINARRKTVSCHDDEKICRKAVYHEEVYVNTVLVVLVLASEDVFYYLKPLYIPTITTVTVHIDDKYTEDVVILGVNFTRIFRTFGQVFGIFLKFIIHLVIGFIKIYIPIWTEFVNIFFELFIFIWSTLMSMVKHIISELMLIPFFTEMVIDMIIFLLGSEDHWRILLFVFILNVARAYNYLVSYILYFIFLLFRYHNKFILLFRLLYIIFPNSFLKNFF